MRVEAINAVRPSALRSVLNYVASCAERKGTWREPSDADIDELAHAFCFGVGTRGGVKTDTDTLLARIEHDAGNLIQAVARRLGEMWCSDDCSFSTVSIAMMRLHAVCHRFSQNQNLLAATVQPTGSVLLTAPPQEQHTFGLSITEHAFIAAGWKTRVFYPDSEAHFTEFMTECEDRQIAFDAVCVSWSNLFLEGEFKRMIRTVRDHSTGNDALLMAGGHSADHHETLLSRLGVFRAPKCGPTAVAAVERRLHEPQTYNGATAIAAAE